MTVNGKQHATKEDHEQGLQDDFNVEPASSGDEELRVPANRPKKTQHAEDNTEDMLKKPPNRKRKAEPPLPSRDPEPGLKVPGTTKKTRTAAPRVPLAGQFQQSRAAKEGLKTEKDNSTVADTPPTSSEGNKWGFSKLHFESDQGSQTSRRRDNDSKAGGSQATSNIHAPAKKRSKRPIKYGAKSRKQESPPEDEKEDLDNISMASEPRDEKQSTDLGALAQTTASLVEDPELRKVPKKKKRAGQTNGHAPESATMNEPELDEVPKLTLREQLGLTDSTYSSLPASSAPQEDMDNIESYVRELPAEADEDTACPICHQPVDQEYYWSFWKGLDRTVKNQATFCHTHRKASAQAEYAAEGYPAIDWNRLSERIKKHRMALYSILAGEAASTHRARYEPLALTGKAAAVPSKRSDLSPSKQRDLAALALDDNAVYPGYYGPRGRRAITECVMALLHTEIKRSVDPVVQTSGPATFVQAVLVPEVAVRLIREDMECDSDEAEDIRERTFEMGGLLNEEIEDEVVLGEEEDDDEGHNEYHL